MHIRKRVLFSACCIALGLGLATLAYSASGTTACALIEYTGLELLPDRILVEPGTSAREQDRLFDLISKARARIENTFGAPRAKPIVVFFQDTQFFWPLKLNAYGSTSFIGNRVCVMVGPKGQNLDVVAHELMHAELFERVGYVRRFTEVPVWFDEGIAMQVDFRPRYELPKGEPIDTTYVRQLETAHQFFQPNDQQLTKNYAAAKAEVAHWLSEADVQSLYQRFERIRTGERFDAALAK